VVHRVLLERQDRRVHREAQGPQAQRDPADLSESLESVEHRVRLDRRALQVQLVQLDLLALRDQLEVQGVLGLQVELERSVLLELQELQGLQVQREYLEQLAPPEPVGLSDQLALPDQPVQLAQQE